MSLQSQNRCDAIVESVTFIDLTDPPRWKGRLQLSAERHPIDILIFNIESEFLAIPARCPHEGYDLTHCSLLNGNTLVCPAHGQCLDLKISKYRVKERDGQFLVSLNKTSQLELAENIFGNDDSETMRLLREEIDKLRLTSLKQEKKIHAITRSMDAMLCESEQQKIKFQTKANQQQDLSRFIDRVLDTIDDLLFVIDTEGQIRRLNIAVERELGLTEADLLGTGIDDLLPPAELQRLAGHLPTLHWPIRSVLLENIRLNGYYSGEHELLGKHWNNPHSLYWLKSSLLHSEQGKLEGAVVTALNITELKDKETELRLSAKVFESQESIVITDNKGIILRVNKAFTESTGYTEQESFGQKMNILKSGRHDTAFYEAMWKSLLSTCVWQGEIWDRRKNGEIYPKWLTITGLKNHEGKVTHYVGTHADITERKIAEEKIKLLAFYDPLTQLPNRRLLKDRLQHAINMERRNGRQLALLMLDLDRFKAVNDRLGHLAGDDLLQKVAARIMARLRAVDTVARWGGDEFVVLLEDIAQPEDAARIADEIIADLTKPFYLAQGDNVNIGASIGICLYPQHGNTPEILMDHADIALYQAKDAGRGCFAYFSEELTLAAKERMALETRLRNAIEQQELRVFYQPQVDIASGRIVGAEALVRWQDQLEGLIPPLRFIPLAEETGLIVEIGAWVLRETCQQGRKWLDAGLPALTLAVNVSPYQFHHSDICALVTAVLDDTGFPANQLELEITESGLMGNQDKAITILNSLHAQDVHLAIDDFGTGYSSLAYLKHFPIDILKIDKSFIDDIPFQLDDMEIAATIISMGHILGFKVLAEGVETPDQLAFLQKKGCDMYQGYIKSKPLPAHEFAELLREQQRNE